MNEETRQLREAKQWRQLACLYAKIDHRLDRAVANEMNSRGYKNLATKAANLEKKIKRREARERKLDEQR